eukprot:COSAG01_NODE_4982_length_4570_cov_5.535003_7_plen_80_part_00
MRTQHTAHSAHSNTAVAITERAERVCSAHGAWASSSLTLWPLMIGSDGPVAGETLESTSDDHVHVRQQAIPYICAGRRD